MALMQPEQPMEGRLSGLNLLQQLVRRRWAKLAAEQQNEIAQKAIAACKDPSFVGSASWPLKSKLASVVSDVAIRMGADFVNNTVSLMREIVYSDGALLDSCAHDLLCDLGQGHGI